MSAKKVFFGALLGMCWSWCSVQAQGLYQPGYMTPAPVTKDAPAPAPGEDGGDHSGTGLSSWITYDRGNCCTSTGTSTPILTEFVVRTGLSAPVGGEYLSRSLQAGWMIEGGVRALFINSSWSKAWAVELSISNTYNDSHTSNQYFLGHTLQQLVTVRALNRTYANLALGREWYLGNPANSGDWNIRVGIDVGGGWGSEDLKLIETTHHTDVTERFFTALHADLEIPYGRWTYFTGFRLEYSYNFSNVFAVNHGSVQDLTPAFSFGVRY